MSAQSEPDDVAMFDAEGYVQDLGLEAGMHAQLTPLQRGLLGAKLTIDVHARDTVTQMIEMGVDNIITDDPALIRTLLDEWNGLSQHEKVALMLRDLIVGLDPPPPSEL